MVLHNVMFQDDDGKNLLKNDAKQHALKIIKLLNKGDYEKFKI